MPVCETCALICVCVYGVCATEVRVHVSAWCELVYVCAREREREELFLSWREVFSENPPQFFAPLWAAAVVVVAAETVAAAATAG